MVYSVGALLALASGKAERRQVHPLKLPACPHQQLRLALVYELDDEFAEERVLPCEPLARELLRVVHVERLVDEPRAGISALQHTQTLRYLGIVGAREGAHHYGHRPRHVVAHVRTADALACLAAEEVWVVLAPDEAARVLIYGVVHVHIAQIGQGEQRRHVGVVHEEAVAEAVHLVGVNLAVLRMVYHGVLLESLAHLVGKRRAVGSERCVGVHLVEYLRRLAQRADRHEVRRHEEEERRSVVGGAEDGGDEPAGLHGVAPAVVAYGVELVLRLALEAIGAQSLLALLLAEYAQDVAHRLQPLVAEHRCVARHLPVVVGEAYGVAERVDLVLALVQLRLHVGHIVSPHAVRFGLAVERIGVGVDVDALQLAAYHTAQHLLQLAVALSQLHVGPHLRCRVAQPHGVYVARVDEGVLLAVRCIGEVDGGVERVREAVLEHPR